MKKINVILLIFSFVLSGIGGIFLFGANAFQQSTISCNAPVEEIMEYTYKTFNDYFVDYDFSNITLSGEGTAEKPFQVNSTEDFLWLLKGNEFTLNMTFEKRGVPSAYEEVAYLQSTGTQIIDTGVVVKNSIRPYIKFKTSGTYNSSGSVQNIFGGSDSNVPIAVSCNYGDGNVTALFAWHGTTYGNGNKISQFQAPHDTIHELKYVNHWIFDGTESSVTQIDATGDSSDITIAFFGTNRYGELRPFNIRSYLNIYAFKLYDGEELVRDYVPCYRKSDGKPGMYDLVTGEFYTNQGEGEFSYGTVYEGTGTKYKFFADSYVKINSDIYLNDETFDKDGNPSGGNGIVYKWGDLRVGELHLDGGEHTIFGLYRKGHQYGGLFGLNNYKAVAFIKNLNMANVYVNGPYNAGAYAWKIQEIENCHVFSGTVETNYGGAFANSVGTMKNCSNRANIIGRANAAGLSASVSYAYNCINYGEVNNLQGGWVGGLFVSASKIENCINYGDVKSTAGFVGGLVCKANTGKPFFAKNCINYGDVTAYTRATGFVQGVAVDAIFENCKNYGKIRNTINGGSYGSHVVGLKEKSTIKINVVNCVFDTGGLEGLITGTGTEGTAEQVIFDRCTLNLSSTKVTSYTILGGANKVVVKSLVVNVKDENVKASLISTTSTVNYEIWNVLFNSNYKTAYNSLCTGTPKANVSIKGGILFNNATNKHFYGSDFSGFYFAWRTGKIGLVALDGTGQFQGTIDEAWLKNRGYLDMTPDADEQYVQLEYLQGTGTQYIDIGYTPNINTKIEAEMAVTSNTNNAMGCNYSGYAGNISFGASGSNLFASFGSTQDNVQLKIPFDTDFHCYTLSRTKLQIDDQSMVPTHATDMTFMKMNLFYYNTTWGGNYVTTGMKIKSFKIYENEKLIMDLIPVKRYDGVLGMYDKYNDKFYTNSGSGNFVAGPALYKNA